MGVTVAVVLAILTAQVGVVAITVPFQKVAFTAMQAYGDAPDVLNKPKQWQVKWHVSVASFQQSDH